MADTIEIIQGTATTVEVAGPTGPQGPAGAAGATGAQGPAGSNGANGQGVPVGGTTGQILRKASGTNYDTEWAAAGSGSGSVTSVALAGTGLSISGSPVTTSGTITANVSYGTTASTAAEGNDTRIANIRSSSIDTRTNIGAGGNINTSGGEDGAGGSINTSNGGGSINTSGGDDGNGGSINTNNRGGSIDTRGAAIGLGGSINTSAGEDGVGGSIETYNGGGSINTRGTGSIGLGVTGTRTTLTGTATANRAISLPNASGTLATTAQAADYEVTDSAMGIILKSPDNTRWRVTINNDGTLSRAALALMTLLAFATSGFAQVRDMVTDTNGNIVTGRTNVLAFTNNLRFNPLTNANSRTAIIGTNGALTAGNPPSGAAANGALLTADGAGSSSFVASRFTTARTTNDTFRTNTIDANTTNNNESQLSIDVEANTLYRVNYYLRVTAPATGGFGAALMSSLTSTNAGQMIASGVGRGTRPGFSYYDFHFVAFGGSQLGASIQGSASGVTNGVWQGSGIFHTGSSNQSIFIRWYQNTTNTNASTLLSNSILQVEKLFP
jgi:hypothetical protein